MQQHLVGRVGNVYEQRNVGEKNTAVLDFSVAVTPRKKNGDEWVDGETYWINVTVWNRLAENVAASLKSGDRVIVLGRTEMKPGFTKKDGTEAPARPIVVADFVGLDLGFDAAHSDRVSKGGNAKSSSNSGSGGQKQESKKAAPVEEDIFNEDNGADDDGFGDDGPLF